jgi:hypothetical protein
MAKDLENPRARRPTSANTKNAEAGCFGRLERIVCARTLPGFALRASYVGARAKLLTKA